MDGKRVFSDDVLRVCKFKTSRSSGSGGQHVNKVETKVELVFDVSLCTIFPEQEKVRIRSYLNNYTDQDGLTHIHCQEFRSQLRNKKRAEERLLEMIEKALTPVKQRRHTKPTRSSQEKRIQSKKQRSELKQNRKKPDY